jgi:hypothetical protein
MRLQQWAANGWLRPHQTTKQQVSDLLAIVDRDLADSMRMSWFGSKTTIRLSHRDGQPFLNPLPLIPTKPTCGILDSLPLISCSGSRNTNRKARDVTDCDLKPCVGSCTHAPQVPGPAQPLPLPHPARAD